MQSLIRERFWIIRARKTIKSILNECFICAHFKVKSLSSGPLPPDRVTDCAIFEVVGIDLAGPLFLKTGENELWFQQDGATCHTAHATIDLLKDTFGDRQISRFGPVNWPPRSCDLTPLDYFLWGYVKSLVYANKSQTLDHLEDNIRRVIADRRPKMLEKVIENWTTSETAVAVICQKSF
ncbi:DUF4817 domain-containing protein [Trichonephila clavipes]|nr:DUF4817 domain-containing protein [Trichonephila clavipes]